jgi:predicted TIM-barrel fold metal-dependent hydrolase
VVIDFHVHLWGGPEYMPPIIWDTFPRVRRRTDYQEAEGSAAYFDEHVWPQVWDPTGDKLVAALDQAGVAGAVIMPMDFGLARGEAGLSIDEKNRRCADVARRHPGRVFSFVGVDPRRPAAIDLARQALTAWGARGLKLYPPTGFYPDDRSVYPLYELALALDVPVAFHTGIARYPLKGMCGHPMYIDAVAADFPALDIVMLHTSWNFNWTPQAIAFAALKPNLHVEVSGWQDMAQLRPERFYRTLKQMITRVGADRVLFASDHTGLRRSLSYADWVQIFTDLPETAPRYGFSVTPEEAALILEGNARRLLRLQHAEVEP